MLASVNTMSSQSPPRGATPKKYELKARADQQRETRDRIARAATELHEEKGVARTTVVEIARRAGVSRLTVYNHFPDLASLLPACTAHYEALHPLPDFGPALAADDPARRVDGALRLLYGWYRETEPMFGKVFSDRTSIPELDEFLVGGIDSVQSELVAALDRGQAATTAGGNVARRAMLGLAVDFWTWRRLSREGLDDDGAAALMGAAVLDAGAAGSD